MGTETEATDKFVIQCRKCKSYKCHVREDEGMGSDTYSIECRECGNEHEIAAFYYDLTGSW